MNYNLDLTLQFEAHPHWPAVTAVMEKLTKAGHLTYLAGGCIRNALLDLDPKDFDIATSALPDEVIALFPKSLDIGKAFGVIMLPQSNFEIEVASFRRDGPYLDARRPTEVYFDSPKADAMRRDFTANALFYDPRTKQVIDFIGGIADIKQNLLQTVGSAKLRFEEDHLRTLRALRFAAQLDFRICPTTYQEIRQQQDGLINVSRERIDEELKKILVAQHGLRSIEMLFDCSMANQVLGLNPSMDLAFKSQNLAWKKIKWIWSNLNIKMDSHNNSTPTTPWTAVLALIFYYNHNYQRLLHEATVNNNAKSNSPSRLSDKMSDLVHLSFKEFRFGKTEIKSIQFFYQGLIFFEQCLWTDKHQILQAYRSLDSTEGDVLFDLVELDFLARHQTTKHLLILKRNFMSLVSQHNQKMPRPLLSGNDLKQKGMASGPEMGKLLAVSYQYQIFGSISSKEDMLDWLKHKIKYKK